MTARSDRDMLATEGRIGRLLILLTYVSVTLLVVGVALLLIAGISPLAGGPAFDPATILPDVLAGAPAGILWLGLLAVIATPLSRVVASAIAYGRAGDWSMVGIAVAVLAIVASGIVAAVTGTV